jgi:SAM-dependent methyltransferase
VEADRSRWDERHADRPPAAPERPEALGDDPALVEAVPTTGTALDLACGLGGTALWLAERGLEVLAVDVSPVAIGAVQAAAVDLALDHVIDARVLDLDLGLEEPTIDGRAPFDVIVCQRFRDRRLYRPIVEALVPGGLALVTVLSAVGTGGQPGDFHAQPGELIDAFADQPVTVLRTDEGDGVASIVVRRR